MRLTLNPVRVLSAGVLGICFGLYMHHSYETWNHRGKDAFLAHQLQRFDHYMSSPQPLLTSIVSALVGAAFAFGIYELLTAILSKVFFGKPTEKPANVGSSSTRPATE